MIKLFATEQVKVLDRYTIQHKPISGADLVEEAAYEFVKEFTKHYKQVSRIVVFAGPGNNGADALAIARMLSDKSYRVVIYLFNTKRQLTPECEEHKRRLLNIEAIEFTEVIEEFNAPELTERDVVIDGLFGSGLNRPLESGFAGLVKYINSSPAEVVAIDVPSGLFGEDNRKNTPDTIIQANKTYTFNFPKLAFLFPENARFVGEWTVLSIDILPEIIDDTPAAYRIVEEADMNMVFPPRARFTHKGTYGHALMIAGSRGKLGAAILSGRACLRSGAGLLTVHVPRCGEIVLQTAFPEAMVDVDEKFRRDINGDILSRVSRPIVLDADALNIIAANKDLLEKVPRRSVLTPHPREFDRLAGDSHSGYERLMKAKDFAKEHQVCVVLKDAYTAVCTSEGNVYFNLCGNPGMATAGSGDVLTGIILGLLAQGYEPETAAVAGVFMHATAGDWAAKTHSQEAMIAGDIVDMLGMAFRGIK